MSENDRTNDENEEEQSQRPHRVRIKVNLSVPPEMLAYDFVQAAASIVGMRDMSKGYPLIDILAFFGAVYTTYQEVSDEDVGTFWRAINVIEGLLWGGALFFYPHETFVSKLCFFSILAINVAEFISTGISLAKKEEEDALEEAREEVRQEHEQQRGGGFLMWLGDALGSLISIGIRRRQSNEDEEQGGES